MRTLFAGVALAVLLSSAAAAQTIGPVGGTATSPGGSSGQVQYNNSGAFGGITTTGSGNAVLSTSPTLVTPLLGTPTSGVATNLTGTAAGLTAGNVTTNANLTGVITSSGNATSIASQTGTGTKFVVDTSPALITPALGVATATSLNGDTFTTGSYTLTGTAAKTLNFTNTLTLSGTDATTMTFPATSDTVMGLATAQTVTAAQTNSKAGAASVSATTYTGTPFAGTGTTSFPLIYANGGTGPTTFSVNGTYFGANSITGFTGNFIDFHLNGGASVFSVNQAGTIVSAGPITLGSASSLSFGSRGILASPVAGNIQLGTQDAASPVAQILSIQSVVAGTSNTAGVSGTFTGSRGTGTGVGGALIFQTAPAGTTGSAQNALVTVQKWDALVHVSYGGTAPALSSCGGSPTIDAHATDTSGTVTAGSAATSCTITFNKAYATWDHCRISAQSSLASFAYSYTLSAIVVTATSLTGNLDYTCDGS